MKEALGKSPINYFSDLFIVAMVIAWLVVSAVMLGVAVYATLALGDTSMWSDVASLVSIPLSCGGAIWMVKNSVQHAIANNRGEQAHMDFPKVDGAEIETEKEATAESGQEGEAAG